MKMESSLHGPFSSVVYFQVIFLFLLCHAQGILSKLLWLLNMTAAAACSSRTGF